MDTSDSAYIKKLLTAVADGSVSPGEALLKLKSRPYEDLGFARIDSHRGLRQGAGEVIFGPGKTFEQLRGILSAMKRSGRKNVIITRLPPDTAERIAEKFPMEYNSDAGFAVVFPEKPIKTGSVVVATGGTGDIPVAEEAALTAETLGASVTRLFDVGVAGLHRLLDKLPPIMTARAVVAVAGMEGALVSVIGGLADCPVIAVPTSIGYGASFGGVAALLSMLNSCAAGVSVVNIDNGFGAGFLAAKINKLGERA